MTQLSPDALEAAAKAMHSTEPWSSFWSTDDARLLATAAITAYLAQAEKEGWVMVPVVKVIDDVAAERRRQSDVEGWTQDHDDRHSKGEMALAAACYAAPVRMFISDTVCGRGYEPFTRYRDAWPWADEWWKPKDRRNDLVRAAALIIAEIERLDRLPAPPMGK